MNGALTSCQHKNEKGGGFQTHALMKKIEDFCSFNAHVPNCFDTASLRVQEK